MTSLNGLWTVEASSLDFGRHRLCFLETEVVIFRIEFGAELVLTWQLMLAIAD